MVKKMKKEFKGTGAYLRFPIQTDAKATIVNIEIENIEKIELFINIAKDRIDYWEDFFLGFSEKKRTITVETENLDEGLVNAVELTEEKTTINWEKPIFHFTNGAGYLGDILKIEKNDIWRMTYKSNPFGLENRNGIEEIACGDSLFSLEKEEQLQMPNTSLVKEEKDFMSCIYTGIGLIGDIEKSYLFSVDGKKIIIGKSKKFLYGDRKCHQIYGMPFQLMEDGNQNKLLPMSELDRLKVWKREWHVNTDFYQKLAFRILPAKWPNIRIEETDGGPGEISSKAFEIQISFHKTEALQIKIYAAGISFTWDRQKGIICSSEYSIFVGVKSELEVTIYSDLGCGEILCEGQAIFVINDTRVSRVFREVDNGVSGNLENCKLIEKEIPYIRIYTEDGKAINADITAYGIRRGTYPDEIRNYIRQKKANEKIIYNSKHYKVYSDHVSDVNYGKPDAWAITPMLVYSPVRVTEEFIWRDTPWGDMIRSVERAEYWRPDSRILNYPRIQTELPVLDATYHIAVDTFIKCKSGRFALEGQTGLWSAGLFQGEKESFGVWMRDSVHIALRGGNFLDPEAAGKTLLYALGNGFDNGSDGCAMAACGIWDYYTVTGDSKVIFEAWGKLIEKIEEADGYYVEEEGLVKAEQSTSNDSLPEPENGGYCLGTQCYYMLAYDSMYRMGIIVGEQAKKIEQWKKRAQAMRFAIQTKYWNDKYGYFTSGPKGSEAFEKGLWESSGEEAAIWPRFGIATKEQRKSVLANLEKTAMSEYGILLFPHKEKLNHFCGSVWTVWEAGFAAAASACGKKELIWKLIAQQIRNCIMNKTFYEVIDGESGIAWRWPGQLWHAAGFLSLLLFGVLGIEYKEDGVWFHPCIPKELSSFSLDGFRYGNAVFDIHTEGTGSGYILTIDGVICDKIRSGMTGYHSIVLKRKK